MDNNRLERLRDQEAKERRQADMEIKTNPLSEYSTTQLKAELRRRKSI